MEKQKIIQELKEAIEQSSANQKRQILYMAKLIYEYRGDVDRDERLDEALKHYLDSWAASENVGTTFSENKYRDLNHTSKRIHSFL